MRAIPSILLLATLAPSWLLPSVCEACETDADCAEEYSCGNDGQRFPRCSDGMLDADDDPAADEALIGDPVNPYQGNLLRKTTDIQTFGAAPIRFTRHYNSRNLSFNAPYWDFGNADTFQHNWNYEARQLSTKTFDFFDIKIRHPSGREYNFKAADATGSQLVPDADSGDRLYRWPGSVVGYTLISSTGFEYHFQRINSPKFQLLEVRDGHGIVWTLSHDADGRIVRITNNFGRYIDISRTTISGVPCITSVTTSDGRQVTYGYGTWAPTGQPVLASVTYPDNTQALYTWAGSDSLTTGRPLLASAIDPMDGGHGSLMSFEYNYNAVFDYGEGAYLVTGTLLTQKNLVNGRAEVTLPNGGGPNPKILEGSGAQLWRRFDKGQCSTIIDGSGRVKRLQRDANGYGFVSSIIDPNGGITQFTRDYAGRPLTKANPDNSVSTFAYNSDGYLVSLTDEAGYTTTVTRDQANRITRIDYPDGAYESWVFNEAGQVITHRRRNGGVETLTYYVVGASGGQPGDLATFTDASGGVYTYTYDTAGRVATESNPMGLITSYSYNWRGQILTTTHADGSLVAREFNAFGHPVRLTDELGHSWIYGYNEYQRLASVTDPLGRVTTIEYGLNPSDSASGYLDTVSRVTFPSGRTLTRSYDPSLKPLSETMAHGTVDAATTTWTYSQAGDLASTTDPVGLVTRYAFDLRHRMVGETDPLGHVTSRSYDSVGNLSTITRPDSGLTQYSYDSMRRVTGQTDAMSQLTSFGYDAGGNLVSLIDPKAQQYAFAYDLLDRRIRMDYPDASHEYWAFDSVGNMVSYTTRAGEVRVSSYDPRGRELTSDWSGPTPDVLRSYDAAGHLLNANTGTLTAGVLNAAQTRLSFAYDDANQLLSETSELAFLSPARPAKTVSYAYDADSNPASLTYPDGTVVTYSYTNRGQPSAIWAGGSSPLATFTYDFAGHRIDKYLQNGTRTVYAYDDRGQMQWLSHLLGSGSFASFSYGYDAVGNRTSMTSHQPGLGTRTDNYSYDGIDQLIAASYGTTKTVSYDYDPAGNRESIQDQLEGLTSYTTNALNQYSSISHGAQVGALGYDTNGNLSSHGEWTYSYDAQSRLISATNGATLFATVFDARNRPVWRALYSARLPAVVVSQVYGAGGNTGATLNSDFVELHNRSDSAIDLSNWSVQYASATGSTWVATQLTGNIAPGGYYLLRLHQGTNGSPLPTPDATGATNLSAIAGKVALVASRTLLTGLCPTGGDLVNLVGYGASANCFENGAPAPAPASADQSIQRGDNGCSGNSQSSAEFASLPAAPRSSASPGYACDPWVTGERYALVYDDWNLVAEYDAADGLRARYFHGPATDELLARSDTAGTIYFHEDAIGNVRALTDELGTTVESYTYDVFGESTVFSSSGLSRAESAFGNRFRFTGREWLGQIRLYDYRHRIYSSLLGRFLQNDPKRFGSGDRNFFRYALNSPTRFRDPFGLDSNPDQTEACHLIEAGDYCMDTGGIPRTRKEDNDEGRPEGVTCTYWSTSDCGGPVRESSNHPTTDEALDNAREKFDRPKSEGGCMPDP